VIILSSFFAVCEASIRNIISHHYHRHGKETNAYVWLKRPDCHRTLEQLPYLLLWH